MRNLGDLPQALPADRPKARSAGFAKKALLTAAASVPSRVPDTLKGMAYMLGSTLAMSSMDMAVKFVSSDMHPFEVAFFRNLFGFLVLTPLFLRYGKGPLRTRRLGLHALRGCIQAFSVLLAFLALSMTELAKVAALLFSAPLFASLLAIVVLGENVRLRRVTALVAGLAGTLIILRPGFQALDPGSVLMLISASAWGACLIVIKVLARTESSATITIYSTIFTIPLTLAAALFVWQMPTWQQLALLLLIGGLGSLGHLCLAQALKLAEATAVLPLDFLKLVWASFYGYVLFAEVPDAWTWTGGLVIFSTVTYIAFRERRVRWYRQRPGGRVNVDREGKLELED